MNSLPSSNGSNGRDAAGRFAAGNPGGPGNPHGRRTALLRSAMLSAVDAADVQAVMKKLIESAKAGEPWAVREFLDRTLGKCMPMNPDFESREAVTAGIEVSPERTATLDRLRHLAFGDTAISD